MSNRFSKFDEKFRPTNPRRSMKLKHKKHENNNNNNNYTRTYKIKSLKSVIKKRL